MEEKRFRLSPLFINFSNHSAKARIISIMKTKKSSFAVTLLAWMLVIGMAIVFATSAIEVNAESSDIVLPAPSHGVPGNNSNYTESEYAALMALKTDDYLMLTVREFKKKYILGSIGAIYHGYNHNDANADFMKTLLYTNKESHPNSVSSCVVVELAEHFSDAYPSTDFIPAMSATVYRQGGIMYATHANKQDQNGEYYAGQLWYIMDWDYSESLTVGERDDVLNGVIDGIQALLESKAREQIGDYDDITHEIEELLKKLNNASITVEVLVEKYELIEIK
jgi:ATP-dependent exoDNAse (exonuclease V) beta subunit